MRPRIFKLLIVFQLFIFNSYGQEIVANRCDSAILTKKEYDKCTGDTAWARDIIIKTNYIVRFKTELLPKYRLIRRAIVIPAELEFSLRQLKEIYDSVLNKKLATLQSEMDRNHKYLQPKAYLSSLLSFQVFNFYPDTYAILLNDIHLQLTPKTKKEDLNIYKFQFENIVKAIPTKVYQQVVRITNDMDIENRKLMADGFMPMFQGSKTADLSSQCKIVNFLLWKE